MVTLTLYTYFNVKYITKHKESAILELLVDVIVKAVESRYCDC